ncbi:MAG: 1-acyl-sn-glycerol-3-phosphate acyltransferase [Thermoanaerobaculia bacterium]
MSQPIVLPLWLAGLLAGLALFALVSIAIGTARWFLRRRGERVTKELNQRFRLSVQPFKLTRHQALVDRLLLDARVLEAAEAHGRESGERSEAVLERVRRYAEEIVPAFNAYIYFRWGYRIARALARSLYRVRLGSVDANAIESIDPKATVVLVMNHRSNMDYLLVSHMVADRTALSYAVGEWARIWPLESLVRWMGAFFVRRNSGDPLYRRVLERYVAISSAEGVTQAVFPEGGLSRDGRLRVPKLGLLDYLARGFDRDGERDLVFVPVGINYDRTLEDRTLLLEKESAGAPPRDAPNTSTNRRSRHPVLTAFGFVGRNLSLLLRQQWRRFGYACVNFGEPLSLRTFAADRRIDFATLPRDARFAEVQNLANELMRRIGVVVPVLPVSLVATIFVRRGAQTLSLLELKSAVLELWRALESSGARLYVPRQDQDYAIDVGLRMLTLRHLVVERDGLLATAPGEGAILAYYANSIAHLVEAAEAKGNSPQ